MVPVADAASVGAPHADAGSVGHDGALACLPAAALNDPSRSAPVVTGDSHANRDFACRPWIVLLAGWLLLAVPHVAGAQAAGDGAAAKAVAKTPLIPRKLLFGNPDKTQARISPDGKHLSYLAPVDGVLNVWVAPVDDLASAKPVTHEKKRPIRSYFWAYDNQHILYAQDANGDEDFHIYRAALDGKEPHDLTPLKKVQARIQEVSHKFPGEILIAINDRNPEFHDVYRLNLDTGKRDLVQKNDGYTGFITDEDYRVRFAEKFTADGGNLFLEPDGKGGWKDFIKVGMADSLTTSIAGFDKSGDVLYLIDSRGRDTGAFTTLDLKSGKETVVAADPRRRRRRDAPSDEADDRGGLVHLRTDDLEVHGSGDRGRVQEAQAGGRRRHHGGEPDARRQDVGRRVPDGHQPGALLPL